MHELEDWDIVSGVGITALGVAALRAVETGRPEPLVRDPYAARFVHRSGTSVPLPTQPEDVESLVGSEALDFWNAMTTYMGLRSKYFDDFLVEAGTDGLRQVVILASGLDARAHRLEWPAGVTLYEIDQPRVLEFKDTVLREESATTDLDRRVVPVDLRENWPAALRTAGFDPGTPTAWLAEGLLPYLPAEAATALFDRIDQLSATGSRLAAEHVDPSTLALFENPYVKKAQDEVGVDIGELWQDGERPDPVRWFTDHAWQVSSTSGDDVADRYARSFTGTSLELFGEYTTLVTARR